MSGYVYKGTGRDVEVPRRNATPTEPPRFTGDHGTPTGYNRHAAAGHRGEEICQPCRDARALMRRQKRAAKGLRPGPKPIYGTGCGTPSGYTVHLRHGEAPCDACRTAYNARKCEYNAARRAAKAGQVAA